MISHIKANIFATAKNWLYIFEKYSTQIEAMGHICYFCNPEIVLIEVL
jgi:hypothetical protein